MDRPHAVASIDADSLQAVLARLYARISAEDFHPSDRASLRRLRPDKTLPSAFYRLLFWADATGALAISDEKEHCMAVLMQAMALASPKPSGQSLPMGEALAHLPGATKPGGPVERRLLQLVRSRGEHLEKRLIQLIRMLNQAEIPLQWDTPAKLLLSQDDETVRKHLFRHYHAAIYRLGAFDAAQGA